MYTAQGYIRIDDNGNAVRLTLDHFPWRYQTPEPSTTQKMGLSPGEGAFLACSFWMADALLLLGRKDDAVSLFERLLALRNDVGLLSEEYDVKRGRLVGNFPQAFSCIALVNTAYNIAQAQKTPIIPIAQCEPPQRDRRRSESY